MAVRVRAAFAALLLTAAALAGCASDRYDGCAPPPNEASLLDNLAAEPVLEVAPEGAKRQELRRGEACHRLPNGAASLTEVSVRYDLSRNLSRAEAVALYEPVIRESGWPPETGRRGEGFMSYCKMVDGRTRVLQITWANEASVVILIHLTEPAQDPCL